MRVAREMRVSFKARDIALEGIVAQPETAAGRAGAVLLCSPEPHLGGTMEGGVVQALARALTERGFLVLRFNYRGVGQSEGKFGMGVGEVEDARAALKVLRSWPGVDGGRVAVAGYSFGAGVAVRIALRAKAVQAAVAVSPPLNLPPVALQGVQGLESFQRPILFLIGERDGLTSATQLGSWIEGLGNPRLQLEVVPGANRSWQGHSAEMASHLARFLAASLGK
ncbi:MAG: alpha/beta fold hydrolase [Chloroflexi bacterium]|nr:alpha/beta fold hydrolase [Chloroflexota bacterium]